MFLEASQLQIAQYDAQSQAWSPIFEQNYGIVSRRGAPATLWGPSVGQENS